MLYFHVIYLIFDSTFKIKQKFFFYYHENFRLAIRKRLSLTTDSRFQRSSGVYTPQDQFQVYEYTRCTSISVSISNNANIVGQLADIKFGKRFCLNVRIRNAWMPHARAFIVARGSSEWWSEIHLSRIARVLA